MAAISRVFWRNANRNRASSPAYLVKVREGNDESVHYFHDEKAVRRFHQENTDLNLFDTDTQQELLPLMRRRRQTGPAGARQAGRAARIHHHPEDHRRARPQRAEG